MDSTSTCLDAAVHELYGVPPEEFVDARKRLSGAARADGDRALSKRITALRRPMASAWAVNRLARDTGDDLRTLLELGAIDQETRRLRAELHAPAERRRAAERQATTARRERANAARRVESVRRRAGEAP